MCTFESETLPQHPHAKCTTVQRLVLSLEIMWKLNVAATVTSQVGCSEAEVGLGIMNIFSSKQYY